MPTILDREPDAVLRRHACAVLEHRRGVPLR